MTHSSPLRRALVAALGLLALLVAPLAAPSAPAQAAASSYVALGDSYSSGVGARSYLADGTACQRSVHAHPNLIAVQRGYAFNFRACSGATVPDVTNLQLDALSAATSYVSVSVGGNDAGFASVLTTCALPWWAGNCTAAVDRAQRYITGTLPDALSTLYARIRSKAPNARVVVVGYPRVFNGRDCNAGTFFTAAEMKRLNETADLLNNRTAAQAAARGFGFANPTGRFLGHAVCDDPEWLNGLSFPITESYHPNRAGQASGYQPVVGPLLTGTTTPVTTQVMRTAERTAPRLAKQQRRYAARDAAIEPQVFRKPDLTTPAARTKARRAGIDLERWLARR